MNCRYYLEDPDVRDFIDRMTNLVKGEWGLAHKWTSKGRGSGGCRQFKCKSLCDAYKHYHWSGAIERDDCRPQPVSSFSETAEALDEFGESLRNPTTDRDTFVKVALRVWRWGGIRNTTGLKNLKEKHFHEIRQNAKHLDPACADTNNLPVFGFMSAGYSKVYSLMIDGFPMYDSRTACGLTSLIWLFCRDTGRSRIPDALALGVPADYLATVKRNPRRGTYWFPDLKPHQSIAQRAKYAVSNLKAGWLVGALAQKIDDEDGFGKAPKRRRLLALQSGLFMIGYKPLEANANRKRRR